MSQSHNAALDLVERMPTERRGLSRSRRQTTSSGLLLARAMTRLDGALLAVRMGVSLDDLEALARGDRGMTLGEQRTLASAVLECCPNDMDLRRRAMALEGQVRAAEDYADGAARRHLYRPQQSRW